MCPASEQQTCSHHGGGDTLDVARRAAVRWRRALAEARRAVGCRRTGAPPGAQTDARGHTAGWRGGGAKEGTGCEWIGGAGGWCCAAGLWRGQALVGAAVRVCAYALGSPSMRGIILSIMHVALTPIPSGLVVSTCTTPRAYGRQTRVRVCAEGGGTPASAPNGARCRQREFECGKGVLARAVALVRARRGRHTRVDGVNQPTTTAAPLHGACALAAYQLPRAPRGLPIARRTACNANGTTRSSTRPVSRPADTSRGWYVRRRCITRRPVAVFSIERKAVSLEDTG